MKKNKGFSMVELIIVIAIMAILAAALAPSLVKYITKARISTDIETAGKISEAMAAALANEAAFDDAQEHISNPQPVNAMDGTIFKTAVFDTLNVTAVQGKTRKDVDGNLLEGGNPQFYYTLEAARNRIVIYYGGKTDDYQIYPFTGPKLMHD